MTIKPLKLTTRQFNTLDKIEPHVEYAGEKKKVKYELLTHIQKALGDKWYNLKDKTQEALDYICMLSTEKGFFYSSIDHIANKHGISKSTVYEIFKQLHELGILCKVGNRSSRKHNGRGCGVYVHTKHPHFRLICQILGIDWKANWNQDCKPENAEIPCGSKDESEEIVSTISIPIPLPKEQKNDVLHYNVSTSEIGSLDELVSSKIKEYFEDDSHSGSESFEEKWKRKGQEQKQEQKRLWFKFVPNEVNRRYANAFREELVPLWRKIVSASKTVKIGLMNKDTVVEVGMNVLRNFIKNKNKTNMTLDEKRAYVYKGMIKALYTHFGFYNLDGYYLDEKLESMGVPDPYYFVLSGYEDKDRLDPIVDEYCISYTKYSNSILDDNYDYTNQNDLYDPIVFEDEEDYTFAEETHQMVLQAELEHDDTYVKPIVFYNWLEEREEDTVPKYIPTREELEGFYGITDENRF